MGLRSSRLGRGAAFFNVSLFWKRTATFSIGRQQIRIDAWTGRLALPARLTLPLDRLRLKHNSNLRVNGQKVYRLTLTSPGGETHQIGAIACTDEDLQTLTNVIEEAQQPSLPDAGTDVDVLDQPARRWGPRGSRRPDRSAPELPARSRSDVRSMLVTRAEILAVGSEASGHPPRPPPAHRSRRRGCAMHARARQRLRLHGNDADLSRRKPATLLRASTSCAPCR